jgi:hypothetical protein
MLDAMNDCRNQLIERKLVFEVQNFANSLSGIGLPLYNAFFIPAEKQPQGIAESQGNSRNVEPSELMDFAYSYCNSGLTISRHGFQKQNPPPTTLSPQVS